MARTTSVIDLTSLAAPDIVEQFDFETIVSTMIADLQARDPEFSALVESDPAYKIIEVCAFREQLLRQRVNEACKALLLAYATKDDLDQIGANYDVARLVVTPADPTTIPPTPAVMEKDAAYRARIQRSFEGYSSAGPIGAYDFFARSASADVKDVDVGTPDGGIVRLTILSNTGNGAAPAATLAAVLAALTDEEVRPLCDTVEVQSASIVNYQVIATLQVFASFDRDTILAAARDQLAAYVESVHALGQGPSLAGIYSALYRPGVKKVVLKAPGIVADLDVTDVQAAFCTGTNVTAEIVS